MIENICWKTQKKTLANRTSALFLDRKSRGIKMSILPKLAYTSEKLPNKIGYLKLFETRHLVSKFYMGKN